MALFNSFRVFVLLVVGIAAYFMLNDPASQNTRKDPARRAPVTAYQTAPSSCNTIGQVAMTIDNGISTKYTPSVLAALDQAGIKATFHISVEWIGLDLVNTIIKQIVARGHVLGFAWYANGYGDPRTLNASNLQAALTEQATKVFNAGGVWPRFIRFPDKTLTGTDGASVYSVATALGFQPTVWSIDSGDYQVCTGSNVSASVANSVQVFDKALQVYTDAGNLQSSFITLHTDLCDIAKEIAGVFASATSRKYTFVTLDQCLGGVPYKTSATTYSGAASSSQSGNTTATTTGSIGTIGPASVSFGARTTTPTYSILLAGIIATLVLSFLAV